MKLRSIAVVAMAAGLAAAQTQVDVKTQTKNVNLSGASFVIPFPTGTSLPALCTTGSMFFDTATGAGSNLYGCVSTNTWVLEGGGAGGGATVSGVLSAQQSSSTVLTIGGSCAASAPCLIQVGSTVYTYTSAALVTLTSGTGSVYLYVDASGNITAGESAAGAPNLACSGCVVASPVTQFPPGSVPLAIWTASGNVWIAGLNQVALQSGAPSFSAGTNVTLAQTGSNVTITASVPVQSCGTTSGCTHMPVGAAQIVTGAAPLLGGTVTVSGLSPTFTSSTSYVCTIAAQSNAATALLSVANVSNSSFAITGPTGSTVTVNYICVGN